MKWNLILCLVKLFWVQSVKPIANRIHSVRKFKQPVLLTVAERLKSCFMKVYVLCVRIIWASRLFLSIPITLELNYHFTYFWNSFNMDTKLNINLFNKVSHLRILHAKQVQRYNCFASPVVCRYNTMRSNCPVCVCRCVYFCCITSSHKHSTTLHCSAFRLVLLQCTGFVAERGESQLSVKLLC